MGGKGTHSDDSSGGYSNGSDNSRSAAAMRKGAALKRAGKTSDEMIDALRADPETADWVREKGDLNGQRELHRIWEKAGESTTATSTGRERDIRVFLGAPYEIADIFLQVRFIHKGHRTLYHYRGLFYEWTGCAFPEAETENLRSRLYDFLATRCYYTNSDGKHCPVNPNPKIVNAIMDGLRAKAHLSTKISVPAWLDGATEGQRKHDPREIVVCSNGLLHLPTMELLPHTSKFFCQNALEFPYNPDAPPPLEWHKLIGQLWPGDFDAIDTLHEMFGYFLTGDTIQQKIFFLIGPRRSGKGTIAKVLRRLLGQYNCCAPTLAGLGSEFGLQPLIGKLAAIIGDARLGGRVDQTAIVERLLSISGEDELNINRKNLTHWVGQLLSRLLILSNELPKLTDASSALVGRFIILRLTQSFFGHEDPGLFQRLIPELPGILNLAIAGWHRLQKRGYFQQPKSSEDVAEQFEDISSPVKQFVRERCALGDDYHITRDALFDAWCVWCKSEGREHPGTKATFGKDLSAAFPELNPKRVGSRGEQVHGYAGIKLREVSPYDLDGLLQCIEAFQSKMGIPRGVFIWGVDFNEHPRPIMGLPAWAKEPPPWVKQRDDDAP